MKWKDYIRTLKIGLLIAFFAYAAFRIYKGNRDWSNLKFEGRIQSIVMTQKNTPLVVVGNKSYYLRPLRDFLKKIKIGDSIIKRRDQTHATVVKQISREKLTLKF